MTNYNYIHPDVKRVRALHQPVLRNIRDYPTVYDQLSAFVANLERAHLRGQAASYVELKNYHPDYQGEGRYEITKANLSREDFELTIARQFGYQSWEEVEKVGHTSFDIEFELAADWIIFGRIDKLKKLLRVRPEILNERSSYYHRSGLIHYIASNGVEIWRQIVPHNIMEMAGLMIEYGADINMTSHIYNGKVSLFDMLTTSAHPEKAGVKEELMRLFQN